MKIDFIINKKILRTCTSKYIYTFRKDIRLQNGKFVKELINLGKTRIYINLSLCTYILILFLGKYHFYHKKV